MDSKPHTTIPLQIGHYQVLEAIGRGGMGLVYRARDTRLERDVAVKCLRTELFEHHYVERFKREALLLAKLNHPNIVQIYDFIEAPDQLALVMELVEGQNLQTYLREHLVPMSQRLHWLTQIAEGLAIAHDAGIIHRDLKAENILINKRGQAKITDLGIAKSQDFNATLTDHVAGSYCSMSPEQAMGESINFKSDLFSLGILAYQLLCGAHPFGDTGNKLQIMQRIISHPPTPPHQHNPDLPAEFVDLLGQLLSKDPNKRPDNTHWVAAQFKKLSTMNVHDNIPSDETQALALPHTNNNNITHSTRTQDHPTFETRFVAIALPKVSLWKKIKTYIAANKIVVGSATLSVLMVAGIVVWQLQPKPPKYVAVIPPKLTAEGMQESQQELVKGAVYDAIQQSVIQLDGYYLIPRDEIADVNGDNETIRRATAADELIITEIECKIEACTIVISRLTTNHNNPESRLIVQSRKTLDVLTDNYLSAAGTVQTNVGNMYGSHSFDNFKTTTPKSYEDFLRINNKYLESGASIQLLNDLDQLDAGTKGLNAAQTLYTEIALDMHHETEDQDLLTRTKQFLEGSTDKEELSHLYNLFYVSIADDDFKTTDVVIKRFKQKNASQSILNELIAYSALAKNDYDNAIAYYQKTIQAKRSMKNLLALSNTYRYSGNLPLARQLIQQALTLSPRNYKAHSLLGLISLLQGDIEEATRSFEVVYAKNPNDIYNAGNLGLSYLLAEEYNSAIEKFQHLINTAPHNTTHQLNLADAFYLQGDREKSLTIYKNIIQQLAGNAFTSEHFRNLSQAYAHTGEINNALAALKNMEKMDSQNIETLYVSSIVNVLSNNISSAAFSASASLQQGMHPIWFKFSWFTPLCSNTTFVSALKEAGASQRCP